MAVIKFRLWCAGIIIVFVISSTTVAPFLHIEAVKRFGRLRTESTTFSFPLSTKISSLSSTGNAIEAQSPPKSTRSSTMDTASASKTQPKKLPIYITIGPQGVGKTTFLSNLNRCYENSTQSLEDITIDDQAGVYIPTPLELWLIDNPPSSKSNSSTNLQSFKSYLNTNLHGKTISQRIYNENREMKLVVQRLNNILSANEFRQQVMSLDDEYMDRKTNASLKQLCTKQRVRSIRMPYDWKESLIHVVEEFHRSEINEKSMQKKSNVVQLFVVESIFKSPTPTLNSFLSSLSSNNNNNNNNNNKKNSSMNAINKASTKLNQYAQNSPNVALSWGNTNTKVTDYIAALEAAEKSQRPVVFIPVLNNRQVCMMDNKNTQEDVGGENMNTILPSVEINELLRRNIKRCYTTGKYIPVKAIIDTCLRVDELMQKAMGEMSREFQSKKKKDGTTTTTFSKQQLDYTLAKMAGFRLDHSNGTVSKFSYAIQSNRSQQKFNNNKYK